jgi:predicted ABC-type ATPase
VYLYLDSADDCVKRVAERVEKGGHSVPEDDIRRRFLRSLASFWQLFRPMAANRTLMHNSGVQLVDVASGSANGAWVREAELYSSFQQLVRIAGNG